MTLECPICADDMSVASAVATKRALGLSCCGQLICQGCLYKHIQSCFEEGLTGQGRSSLNCPLGCGHELTDKTVRATIDRAHPTQWIWGVVGYFLFHLVRFLTQEAFHTSFYYDVWYHWSHCMQARHDLERYEQWSLAVALRTQPTMHCPSPGCRYMWTINPLYQRHKRVHEAKTTYLWYSPPKADKTFGHFDWVEAEFVNMGQTGKYAEPDLSDGRRMVCASCLCTFCGLCRRPWELSSRRKSHRGITCQRYARIMPFDSDYAFVSQMENTRCCPGCSMRVTRIAGCNHMTCACGFEWCYVCECHWNPLHYQCREQTNRQSGGDQCVIT